MFLLSVYINVNVSLDENLYIFKITQVLASPHEENIFAVLHLTLVIVSNAMKILV